MKLSFTKKSIKTLSVGFVSALMLVMLAGSSAQAVQIPYEDIGSVTIDAPTFNTFTNVPNGIGNEADFVRIRKSTGDVADNQGGARNFEYVNGLNAECKAGDKYDVRTYIHNGAGEDFNENGSGSGVAKETELRMVAPFNSPGKTHTFTTTIRSVNASPATDTARLYCQSAKDVTLKLVPQSVKVYAGSYGYQNVSDSAVNGVLPIGSRVAGSGDVWGCWAERVIVAYIVEVVEIPQVVPVYVCDLLSVTALGGNKYRFNVAYTAKDGAVFKNVSYDFGDGNKVTDDTEVDHTYATENKTFKAVATVNFTLNGQTVSNTSANCAKDVTVTKDNCTVPGKEHLPKNSPECKTTPVTPPTALPNTGAGSTVAIILAAVTALGTYAHRAMTLKRQ